MSAEQKKPGLWSGTALLSVNDLKVHFPQKQGLVEAVLHPEKRRYLKAVDGVTFKLQAGETLGVAGESGCGKTTLAKTLVRLYRPTEGEILFLGERIAHLKGKELTRFRKKAQMVFQDPYESLNPRFTVRAILEEPLIIHGFGNARERQERIVSTLGMAGLLPPEAFLPRYPHEMSGGQRQRVAIARVLVLEPSFLVADEPVSMLDVSIRAGVLNLLGTLIQRLGLAGIYISHDLSLIRYMCDRTAVMYLGRIVEMGSTEGVIRHPLHPYTQALVAAVPVPEIGRPSRVNLEDEPPNPLDIPRGCRFHPRCPRAKGICQEVPPPSVVVDADRQVECHLYS